MSTYSFEMYPPRSAAAELSLYETIDRLVETEPEFISVTYGASGSTRESSLGVLRHLLTTSVRPMAHLTCVGWTYEDATAVIREFLDVGLTNFLAVRGDPPAGRGRSRWRTWARSRRPRQIAASPTSREPRR